MLGIAGLNSRAEQLLIGVSVYREPADANAVVFHLGEHDWTAARAPDRRGPAPPYQPPPDLPELIAACTASGLLQAVVRGQARAADCWQVDPWVAGDLHQHLGSSGRVAMLTAAHRQAAEYWQWRATAWPQDRRSDLHDLLEARHHLFLAGDTEQASELTHAVCAQLHAWGDLGREAELIQATLALLPARSVSRANWMHELGTIYQVRGEFGEAYRCYSGAVQMFALLNHYDGISRGQHSLGVLAQAQGDYRRAERHYKRSTAAERRAGQRPADGPADAAELADGPVYKQAVPDLEPVAPPPATDGRTDGRPPAAAGHRGQPAAPGAGPVASRAFAPADAAPNPAATPANPAAAQASANGAPAQHETANRGTPRAVASGAPEHVPADPAANGTLQLGPATAAAFGPAMIGESAQRRADPATPRAAANGTSQDGAANPAAPRPEANGTPQHGLVNPAVSRGPANGTPQDGAANPAAPRPEANGTPQHGLVNPGVSRVAANGAPQHGTTGRAIRRPEANGTPVVLRVAGSGTPHGPASPAAPRATANGGALPKRSPASPRGPGAAANGAPAGLAAPRAAVNSTTPPPAPGVTLATATLPVAASVLAPTASKVPNGVAAATTKIPEAPPRSSPAAAALARPATNGVAAGPQALATPPSLPRTPVSPALTRAAAATAQAIAAAPALERSTPYVASAGAAADDSETASAEPRTAAAPAAAPRSGRRRPLLLPTVIAAGLAFLAAVGIGAALARPGGHHLGSGQATFGRSASPEALSAGAVRAEAATWVVAQVSSSAVVACDPAECAALHQRGLPAGDLLTLGPGGPADPLSSDVIVVTAAVRAEFGARLADVYAPAILASFGSGTAGIQVRLIAADGTSAYQRAARADLVIRRRFGAEMLRNSHLLASGPVRRTLAAGQVDSRLLATLATLADIQSLRILSFGDGGPHASGGVPLRSAEIAAPPGAPASWLRTALRFFATQQDPFLPSLTAMAHPAGAGRALLIEYPSPSLLGLLGASGATPGA